MSRVSPRVSWSQPVEEHGTENALSRFPLTSSHLAITTKFHALYHGLPIVTFLAERTH